MAIPIRLITGVKLEPIHDGVSRAVVVDAEAKNQLSWDRFVRLKAAAETVLWAGSAAILDAGGFDGGIALFLPDVRVDVIDPATTCGSVLDMPVADSSYDAVVAVDLLEHIEPKERSRVLSEFARVARKHIVLNYPCADSKDAQELVLKLTGDELVREHVEWELPDTDWVLSELRMHGFEGRVKAHTSIAVWLGQHVTLKLIPEVAVQLNRHLVEHFANEPCSKPLYHLIFAERKDEAAAG